MSISMAGSNPIEEPLLFAQQFWRATLDALPSQVAILNDDGTIIEVNQGWRNFADANGYRGENYCVGSNYLDICERTIGNCEDGHTAAQGIRAVFAGAESVFTLEYPCHSPVEKRWFLLRATRFTLPGHTYALIEHRNVTAQKLATEAQREQRQWLQATLTSIGDAVLATDAQGRVIFLNRVAEELTGWQQAEAKGVPLDSIFRIINEETRQPVENPVTRVLREGKIVGLANHTALIAKDGTERPIDDSAAPIMDEQGQVNGAVLVFRDISERKRGEQRRNARLAVTKILAEATTLQQAVPAILQAVCESLNWDVGSFWGLDSQANRLRCLDIWQLPTVPAGAFVEICRNATFATGEGIPGRVWESAQPVWVPDVLSDENFPRANVAAGAGLHGAFAAPIKLGSEFVGVIEFFSHEFREPDADLLEMMNSIGGQIGQFMERKRAEEELRQNEEDLTDFFENAAIGLHWVGADGTILRANQAELDLLGYTREEYVGRNIKEFHADEGIITDILHRLQSGQTLYGYEARLRCKDGSIKFVCIDSNVRRKNGRFVNTRCFTRDITDLKRAQALLAGEKQALERITRGEPLHEILEFLTKITEELSGGEFLSSVLLLDRDGVRLRHGAAPSLPPSYNAAIDGIAIGPKVGSCGTAAFLKERVIVSDIANDPLWADFRDLALQYELRACWSTPFFSSDGKVLGTFAIYYRQPRQPRPEDIQLIDLISHTAGIVVERKRAEEAQTFLASIVETSDDAIIGKTLDGTILSWNKGAERIYGYSAVEAVGQSISMLIPASQPDDLHHITEQLKRGKAVDHFETVRMTKDGRLIDVSLTISPLRDEYDRVAAASVIARDITKSKRAEAMLREADRRKDEFLAMLAHELRNPLAPIRNSIEILSLRGTDTDVVNQTREVIDRQVQQMTRMVDDLLDVSRITRGKIQLKKEPANLTEIIKAAVETSRPLIESRHHRLTVNLGNDSMYLEADFARLAQVLTNLLNNAAKYTEVGGQIWVTAEQTAGEFVVQVRDTGVGIAPEALPQVFDLFTQEERSLDRAQGGLGIGLTLARRLVEMHGGTIEVSSAGRGKGSEFTVRLPALLEPAASQSTETVKAQPAVASRKRILVVDDNADSAESLAMLLSIWGHEVVIAHNGLTGLKQAETHSPEVVFLDIGLPKLDGYEVAQRLRQHADLQNTLLIAMTGYGQEEDRRRTREAGFHHHLVKPIDFDKLEELLASSGRATG